MRPIVLGAVLFVSTLVGCDSPKVTHAEAPGCTKDTDCKGDRICESGRCTSPPSPGATTGGASTGAAPTSAPAAQVLVKLRINTDPDGASVTEDGVALCSSTPCDILYKGEDATPTREHRVTLARNGYRSETRTLRAADSPVNVKLIGSSAAASRGASPSSLPF